MVSQVWLRLRATAKKIPSSHRNKVAFRRSVYQNEWSPALLVASHGPERSRHRYSGPTEARPLGNFALLSLATLYDRELRASSCRSEEADTANVEHRQNRYLNNRVTTPKTRINQPACEKGR